MGYRRRDSPVGCAKGQQNGAFPNQRAVELTELVENTQAQLGAPLVDGDSPDLTLHRKRTDTFNAAVPF